jgi:eukaryotic-like serine/threonine-protein kinase
VFKFITHRPLWLNILVALLLSVGLFSVFVLSLNWLTHHNSSKTVPNVTGKTFDDAESYLEKAGFTVEIQDSIYTDTAKGGVVLKQFPEADEIVKVNRTVFLTINRKQPPLVPMPNLLGFSLRNAEMTLLNSGLKVGDTSFRPDFAKNAVLEQRYNGVVIAPDTKIRMGSKISLVIGDGIGNQEFSVPSLFGMTVRMAKTLLEANGLVVGVMLQGPGAEPVTDTLTAYIYKQNPERYDDEKKVQKIRSGQTIDIWFQAEKPVRDSTATNIPLPE